MRKPGKLTEGWGFLRGVTAGGPENPFLDQLQLVRTPWFGVYLHVIHRADEPDPHDHPWWFASLVLCGYYREAAWPDKADPCSYVVRGRTRFSVASTSLRAAHRVTEVQGPVWTLVLTGPEGNDWGFYRNGQHVPWREYQNREEEG